MSIDTYIDGVNAGQGVNLGLKTVHGQAVEGQLAPSLPEATGIEVVYLLTVIRDHEELMKAFSLSAEFSYSGLFSASASASFLSQSRFSRYRTYVMARCVVGLPDATLKDPKLKAHVPGEAITMTEDRFAKIYGTEYLAGVKRGGAYYGVIEIESTSSSEQERIAIAVSASGWGFSADVSISKQLEKVTESMSKRVFVVRQGGPASLPNPTTADDIITQAVSFPQAAAGAAVVIKGIYQRYDQTFAIQFKEGPGEFDWNKRQADLQFLGRRYLKLKQLRNDYDYVIHHYNDYLTGSGVIFEIAGQSFEKKALSTADSSLLAHVQAESDTQVPNPAASARVTVEALAEELQAIEEKLLEVTDAADKCKKGDKYVVPAAYVAKIGLPKIKGKNMELELMKKRLIPQGAIAMWSGPAQAIPEGWLLCDGSKGTPDLRDRFIRGAARDAEPQPLSAGGPDQHTHYLDPPSFEAFTDPDGQHAHRFPPSWYHRGLDSGEFHGIDTFDHHMGPNLTVQPDGQHRHRVAIDMPKVQTELSTSENKPKWFALCFIMKE